MWHMYRSVLVVLGLAVAATVVTAQQDCLVQNYNNDVALSLQSCCNLYPDAAVHKRVVVRAGDYNVKPFVFPCDNLELNLVAGATLVAPKNPDDWGTAKSLVGALARNKISITGAGLIDGNAAQWWVTKCTIPGRPFLVQFVNSNDVSVTVKLRNSPMFHLVFNGCNRVLVDQLEIRAPYTPKSCNLDGIDLSGTHNGVIRNSFVESGDDNVSIKDDCTNITVHNMRFTTGHGASIGSIHAGVTGDVEFNTITLNGTDNGARIKTWLGFTGHVYDIRFIAMTMTNVKHPIVVQTNYTDPHLVSSWSLQEEFDRAVFEWEVGAQLRRERGAVVDELSHPLRRIAAARSSASAPLPVGETLTLIEKVTYHKLSVAASPKLSVASIACQDKQPCVGFVLNDVRLDIPLQCTFVHGKGTPPLSPSSVANCLQK